MENSIYHGLRVKEGKKGNIEIAICETEGKICLTVTDDGMILRISDNGVGMSEAELENIWNAGPDSASRSFGLKGTIERMQIFYETQDICTIDSRLDEGTTITFFIPTARCSTDS